MGGWIDMTLPRSTSLSLASASIALNTSSAVAGSAVITSSLTPVLGSFGSSARSMSATGTASGPCLTSHSPQATQVISSSTPTVTVRYSTAEARNPPNPPSVTRSVKLRYSRPAPLIPSTRTTSCPDT